MEKPMTQSQERFLVEGHEAGGRLDRFLSARMPAFSRARLQSFVRDGHVTINKEIARRPSQILRPGDEICVTILEEVEPSSLTAQKIPLDILYEDETLIILNKPAGLVIHPGAGNREGTLVNALLYHCAGISAVGGVERPGIVHRLDKETSGCLIIAKSDVAHRSLSRQFADRTIEKTYLALVEGVPRMRQGIITASIARHQIHRKKMAVSARGREATTLYRMLGSQEGQTLLECRPQTGRTHQIRVHLKYLGHPVVGDITYGRRGFHTRHYLHAWKIAFRHPIRGERLEFLAPLPSDFPSWAAGTLHSATSNEKLHSLDCGGSRD